MNSAIRSQDPTLDTVDGSAPIRYRLGTSTWACWTDRTLGDLSPSSPDGPEAVACRRATVSPYPWSWLRQVHGTRVVGVVGPGDGRSAEADAAVTARSGVVLSVVTADCAAVALWSEDGVGVAHAGWRGLRDGVLEAAVAALRSLGDGPVHAAVGPAIGPCCYEFGDDEVHEFVAAFGPGVRSRTAEGRTALDLVAVATVALARVGVALDASRVVCTACDAATYFSHRARGEKGRQALAVWREDPR